MSTHRARKPIALLALVSGGVALAAAAPSAPAVTYEPACAPPNGIVNVAHDFPSLPNKPYEAGGTKLLAEVWVDDDIKTVEPPTFFEPARVGFTYRDDPNAPKHFIPEFRQALAMPAQEEIDGNPIVDYLTSIQPYGKNGTEYNNAGTHGTIYPDFGPRVYLAEKKVKAVRHARVTAMIRGFHDKVMYAHVVSSSGKVLRHQKIGKGTGDDTCGRRRMPIGLRGAKPGTWKIVVNTSRTSKSGGASATVRTTR